MPRQVDRQAQRRLVAEALWRVTIRDGLPEASLRHVAAEAGVSMGLIQHYFASKDEMLLFALDTLHEHVTQRVGEHIAALPNPDLSKALVRTVLVTMLPLDEERRADAVVGFAFLAEARTRPRVAAVLREGLTQLEDFFSAQIRRAQVTGAIRGDIDPEREAATLVALMDGLTANILAGQRTPETALAVLDDYLNHLFSAVSARTTRMKPEEPAT